MEFLFVIIILIMSVVIHEVAHGYAALALGDTTAKYQGRLTLNPVAHLDPVGSFLVPIVGYLLGGFVIGWAKPVPFNPYNLRPGRWGLPAQAGEALVAVAGPLSNIAIAAVFGLIIRTVNSGAVFGPTALGLMSFIVLINITLALFNLLPVPPLDGSKILFAIMPQSLQSFRYAFERIGFLIVLLLVFSVWQFLTPFIYRVFSILTGLAF